MRIVRALLRALNNAHEGSAPHWHYRSHGGKSKTIDLQSPHALFAMSMVEGLSKTTRNCVLYFRTAAAHFLFWSINSSYMPRLGEKTIAHPVVRSFSDGSSLAPLARLRNSETAG